ncbi:hypothetical protein [Pseudoalteromonas sp.]|uniref:hypothetical protein n=1 Tax=Pseudoalteromonas sp. TaxID=53249 RepID=UPI00356AA94C
MNTPTKIEEIFNQPTFHFWHLGQEYFIYLNVSSDEEGKEPRMFVLATPKRQGDYYISQEVLRSQHWQIAELNAKDVREGIEKLFLPKVNDYLAAQGGGEESTGFPITGEALEQYNYVVENLLHFNNGQVTLIKE